MFRGIKILALSILRYIVPVMGLLFVLVPAVFWTNQTVKANADEGT
jgi:hypothetical protein